MIRWADLQYREKIALAVGVAVVALSIIYLLLAPLVNKRSQLREDVARRQAELSWMKNSAQEIKRAGATASGAEAVSPLKRIDQTARANNLSEQLKRLEPGAGNEIRVWLENTAYTDLIHWLRQLTSGGQLTLSNLSVERSGAPGRVNARLTFVSGGGS